MRQERKGLKSWRNTSGWLWVAMLAVSGCSKESAPPAEVPAVRTAQERVQVEAQGSTASLGELPFVDALSVTGLFIQKLEQPTSMGETTAVHVKLPPPANRELAESLVRVVGDPEDPVVLFRSDALVQLGAIPQSPGPGFFTLFSQLPESELERRWSSDPRTPQGGFGALTRETILFNGRHPAARFEGLAVDARAFRDGALIPITSCPVLPASTEELWGKTLLIRDPAVVLDAARTWDPCTGAGTQGGVWTFAHLMRQMAQGSGASPEDFVTNWLSLWLNDYQVNGDNVPARRKVYDEVIAPWAAASGVLSGLQLNPVTGRWEVLLGDPLNLDIAPFRLVAIVNRIDLARNTAGGYGRVTSAGELRFVFGLTRPSPWGKGGTEETCNPRPFTVIFEYGVPRAGCQKVKGWARQWARLGTHATFDESYRAQLAEMTQSVVLHGKAPGGGNQSALNQLRTNEIALGLGEAKPWELREFRLTDEDPGHGTDRPSNGLLRVHTVALTPDDATHDSQTDPDVGAFVRTTVKNGVRQPVQVPTRCAANYTLPPLFNGRSFQGGNAQVAPPTHWAALNALSTDASEVCARKEFSGNTCNGCHFKDTGTTDFSGGDNNNAFTHVSPTTGIPARLSKFMTGGGAGFMFLVPDAQFGASVTSWPFADLLRRHQLLYDLAACSTCGRFLALEPGFLGRMEALAGAVPYEVVPGARKPPFKVGPIRDVAMVEQILELRPGFKADLRDTPLGLLRPPEVFVH
ncbi:hypothetical protein D7X12_24575 [Corallococcus sicarius]|uniref:Uncharacterized protein n=1 Tax=Corallococcus sicarius TaxID=2316726 RepID=A0A3A8NI38_9BACT|nr:hypothetical protein D7X12_24575 [Corallococcus sicarius]